MKKILFVLAALLTVSVSLNAQSFDKSKIYVGGTLGFTSTSEKTRTERPRADPLSSLSPISVMISTPRTPSASR